MKYKSLNIPTDNNSKDDETFLERIVHIVTILSSALPILFLAFGAYLQIKELYSIGLPFVRFFSISQLFSDSLAFFILFTVNIAYPIVLGIVIYYAIKILPKPKFSIYLFIRFFFGNNSPSAKTLKTYSFINSYITVFVSTFTYLILKNFNFNKFDNFQHDLVFSTIVVVYTIQYIHQIYHFISRGSEKKITPIIYIKALFEYTNFSFIINLLVVVFFAFRTVSVFSKKLENFSKSVISTSSFANLEKYSWDSGDSKYLKGKVLYFNDKYIFLDVSLTKKRKNEIDSLNKLNTSQRISYPRLKKIQVIKFEEFLEYEKK